MRVSYGTGLLMWHCFCDERGIPEEGRAPAMQALISSFVAHLAAAYSGRTIAGYVNGVQAWCYIFVGQWTAPLHSVLSFPILIHLPLITCRCIGLPPSFFPYPLSLLSSIVPCAIQWLIPYHLILVADLILYDTLLP